MSESEFNDHGFAGLTGEVVVVVVDETGVTRDALSLFVDPPVADANAVDMAPPALSTEA